MAKAKKSIGIRFLEEGTSGLKAWSGFVSEAYNASLYWPAVQPLYSKLRTSMPEIVMVRRAFSAWARNITPIVDLPPDATDDDKRYQEFVLQEFENVEGGFARFIDTVVNQVPFFGWGWWETVPAIRSVDWKPPDKDDDWQSQFDDGLIGLRRLAWRDTSTFNGWILDDKKRLRGMKQRDYPNTQVDLPLSSSLHMTFGDANNPEGSSPLEAVWRLERIRFGLEVIMGIGYEHSAGFLNIKKTESGNLSDKDKTAMAASAKAILTAKEGNYAYWPFGLSGEVMDINFAAGGNLLTAIQHYSILTLSIYTMQWIALNTMTQTGALASQVDSTQAGIFAFNAMMDGFASQYDDQVGRRLWQWNRDAFPNATARPDIRFSHIDNSIALGELGTFLSAIKDVLPLGKEDMEAFRKRSGFLPENEPDDAEIISKPEPQIPAVSQNEPSTPGGDQSNDGSDGAPDGKKAQQAKQVINEALEYVQQSKRRRG